MALGFEFWDESNASRPPLKIADDLMLPSTEEVQLIELEHPVESYHLEKFEQQPEGAGFDWVLSQQL